MKNLIDKVKNLKIKEKLTVLASTFTSTIILANNRVLAASNTGSIDAFINFACDWLTKIGGIIALVGGVMFALRMAKRGFRGKIKRTYDSYGRFYACCYCSI